LIAALALTNSVFAQQPPLRPPGAPPPPPVIGVDEANYIVRVQWKEVKGSTNFLQILTTEGPFTVNTARPGKVTINNADVPVTLDLRGNLEVHGPDKGMLKIFLGRTFPYVTGTTSGPGGTTSTYQTVQQLKVGLDSTIAVTFGKPVIIQADDNEEVSIVVTRDDG
jgi:hypothetical protein